ncbi:MAG: phosphonate metabolism transcriptional regulator PhnF [Firmicutes bacterium]|nr:phosphonate metabolism transcriptional regulator PhnF [Bacillota bacterium]
MIDRENGIPYYRQVMDLVEEQIAAKVFKEGDQLPSETELSGVYGVNRHTIRQALGELCRSGVVYRVKGRGTFIAKRPLNCIEYKLTPKNRFSENILEIGGIPSCRVLKSSQMAAPDQIAELLRLEPGEQVYYFEILRMVNGHPFLISYNFAPVRRVPGMLERLQGLRSLFVVYQEHYGIALTREKTTVHASFPSAPEAVCLQIPTNMPVLKVESVLKDQGNQCIQYTSSCYRGDLVKLDVGW